MQFQGKLMIQTEENDENLIFGLDLGLLGLNLGHIFFFFKKLASSVTRCYG